jgi:tetratricopeptide (TPR) repeat protein
MMRAREIRWAVLVVVTALVPPTTACSKTKVRPDPAAKDTTQLSAATVTAVPAAATTSTTPAPALESHGMQRSYDEEALGHLDAALSALDEVPASASTTYVVTLRRGWLLYRLGRTADAITDYKRAVDLAPTSIEARVGLLAPLAALRRWVDVDAAAREVLKKDPGNYQATIRLAFAQYSLAKFADAAATYRALLAAYPSDVDVQGGLGWSLLKLGKKSDAAAAFTRTLEIAPRNALATDGLRAAGGSN